MRFALNKFALFFSIVLVGAALAGCGPLFTQEELNPEDLPLKLAVNTSSPFFTAASITFTGDPETDFGASYQTNDAIGDDVYDANNGGLTSSYAQYDLQFVYVAFDTNFLYIGHKTTNDLVFDSTAPDYMGACMIVIDNGLTEGDGSNGVTNISPAGYSAAGLSGDLGLDNMGVGVTEGSGKITLGVKHWRTEKQAGYKFFAFNQDPGGVVETVTPQCFYDESSDTGATGITEVAIPWKLLYDSSYVVAGEAVAPPAGKIKVAIIADPTLDQEGGRDFFPNNSGDNIEDMVVNTWLELDIQP